MPASDLVFGDQMGTNLAMTPTHGRAERGQRVVDSVPKNHGKNMSTMGMLGLTGMLAMVVREGAFNADMVYDFFEKDVVEKLRPGQVVILDNARIHKKRECELRLLLARAGCRLVFLPPYSPEWNPIEHASGGMKQVIRKLKARTRETLLDAIYFAATFVTHDNTAGWYHQCGHAH